MRFVGRLLRLIFPIATAYLSYCRGYCSILSVCYFRLMFSKSAKKVLFFGQIVLLLHVINRVSQCSKVKSLCINEELKTKKLGKWQNH